MNRSESREELRSSSRADALASGEHKDRPGRQVTRDRKDAQAAMQMLTKRGPAPGGPGAARPGGPLMARLSGKRLVGELEPKIVEEEDAELAV